MHLYGKLVSEKKCICKLNELLCWQEIFQNNYFDILGYYLTFLILKGYIKNIMYSLYLKKYIHFNIFIAQNTVNIKNVTATEKKKYYLKYC